MKLLLAIGLGALLGGLVLLAGLYPSTGKNPQKFQP